MIESSRRQIVEERVMEYLNEYTEEHIEGKDDIEKVDIDEMADEICNALFDITFDNHGNQISYLHEVTNIISEFFEELKSKYN